jgi:hypothetical protein
MLQSLYANVENVSCKIEFAWFLPVKSLNVCWKFCDVSDV